MNIMWMRFLKRCSRNLDESACFFKLLNSFCSTISHTGTETAHELEYSILNMSFVSNTSFYAFRNKFLRILLEVTVFTSVLHSCDRSHTAVYFIFSALIQFECSRALVASCKHASHHADIRTGCDCLCDISGILDTTVCNDRDSVFFCSFVAVHNSSDLRNTDTCNNSCGTDRSRSDTNLNCIYTGLDQSLCRSTCCYVTCDYLQFRICCLDLAYSLQNIL